MIDSESTTSHANAFSRAPLQGFRNATGLQGANWSVHTVCLLSCCLLHIPLNFSLLDCTIVAKVQMHPQTPTMNGHTTTLSYAGRLEAFRKSDTERDALVAEVIRNYEELQLKYAEKCDDYSNEVESRRMWQTKATSNERALVEHKQISVWPPTHATLRSHT